MKQFMHEMLELKEVLKPSRPTYTKKDKIREKKIYMCKWCNSLDIELFCTAHKWFVHVTPGICNDLHETENILLYV